MAHKILGIELGAYSVKVVVATAGFRSVTITDYLEAPVPAGDGPAEERAAHALGKLLRAHGLEHDVPYAALPGDGLSMRVLDFGFTGLKRADLDKAIGAELEAQLPHDLDELVYDFEVLPPDVREGGGVRHETGGGGAAGRDGVTDPAFVAGAGAAGAAGAAGVGAEAGGAAGAPAGKAPSRPAVSAAASGTRVLAAATTRDRVKQFLALGERIGGEPRSVLAAPTVYARVAEKLAALGGGGPGLREEAVLFIDHGHTRTNLCVVRDGKALFARTLSRGGRHVTQAISRACNISFEDAERAKHSDAFVASALEPMTSMAGRHPGWTGVSDVIKQELTPLVRDLRQTLSACRAQTGAVPRRAVLAGGGGRLRGLAAYLSEELGLSIGRVTAEDAARLVGPTAAARGAAADSALLAHGVALEGATGRPLFDLRKGELAYRADFSFLRAKAGFLAACALILVAFAAANAYAALYKLRKEEKILDARLDATTAEIFGQAVSAGEVQEKLAPKKEQSPLPKTTAFDQLVEISKHLPGREAVKLDVGELDIKPGKITLKATTDSQKSIDEIEKKLKEIECFTDIQRGKVSGEAEKQFTLTITTKCM